MKIVIAIAAGGALGAVGRHFLDKWITLVVGSGFPWGILTINAVGCFAMGVLIEAMALVWSPSLEMRAFLIVGFLGGLTTFSSFSLDVAALHGRGEILLAGGYVIVSVVASLGGIFGGLAVGRTVFQ